MSHYLIELLIWCLIAYVLGCILGWILRNVLSGNASPAMAAPEVAAAAVGAPGAIIAPAAAALSASPGKLTQPKGIKSARGGKADELQRLSGVGPKNEVILHHLGFFHFDQIAAWTREEVDWVDDHLKFGGRIAREEWVRQAKLLADGKEDEFRKEFGTGGMKGGDGHTHSGTHTKK